MATPTTMEQLKAMCAAPNRNELLKKVSKEDIAKIVASYQPPTQDEYQELKTLLQNGQTFYQDEMKKINTAMEKMNTSLGRIPPLEKKVSDLEDENTKLHKIVTNQQSFIEMVDGQFRQKNVVIVGVSEDVDGLGETDIEKVKAVLTAIGKEGNADGVVLKRLGLANERNQRPILATFGSNEERNSIKENAKKLKNVTGDNEALLKEIYINKDIHPAIRRENGRLNKVAKEEKEKPENQGVDIVYDRKTRTVTRNGLVIDRFKLDFQ